MGKTKTKSRSASGKDILHTTSAHVKSSGRSKTQPTPTEDLLAEAAQLLEQSQPELAVPLVNEALRRLEGERDDYASLDNLIQQAAQGKPTFPEALVLAADIYLGIGGVEEARTLFLRATSIDPDGALISAEPWLWLAQLCEEGGKKSIEYFERATEVLQNEAEVLEEGLEGLQGQERIQSQQLVDEKRAKLADALCGMAEVYMTDLSWEKDTEARSESYATQAVAICPERLSAGTLQTLANVRISQERFDEARQALARSMTLWKDLPDDVEDSAKPGFATRVSLVRLLMDVQALTEAMFVVEGLVREDDQSIESLYLGGWCQVLLSQDEGMSPEEKRKHEEQARLWLGNCLKQYKMQDYEDDRLQAHTLELIEGLNTALGISGDDDEWEDEEDDADEVEEDDLEVVADAEHRHPDGDIEMT